MTKPTVATMTGIQLWNALLGVADDGEADALESMAIQAGLFWRCDHTRETGCGYVNEAGNETCEECGIERVTA